MMADRSVSTSMFVPMAASLAFGVLMGTVITLFLVPCLVMILEDWLVFTGKRSHPEADAGNRLVAAEDAG
jgi:Cu/Ag efflux pump CusA